MDTFDKLEQRFKIRVALAGKSDDEGRAQGDAGDAEAHEATRVLFADWCTQWLAWAKLHHKGYATDVSRVTLLSRTFGPLRLDEVTTAGVETFQPAPDGFAHASELLVREGEEVSPGQPIARVGQTGRATGSHLHFELREGGRPVDPSRALKNYRLRADDPIRSGS